jgi:hypothetical protein
VLFKTAKNNYLAVGINDLCIRFHYMNGQKPLEWLNNSIAKFKIDCKNKLLSFD